MATKKKAKKAAPKKAKKAVKKKAPAKKKPAPRKAAKKAAPKKKAPAKKKAARPQPQPKLPWRVPLAGETHIGVVDDYYGHIGVIAFTLTAPLSVGARIHVRGHTTDLSQMVESIQIGHQSVQSAAKGDAVGVKVGAKCRAGDYIYLSGV